MKCVLVVDDETAIRSLVEASLAAADCTVIGAKDGPSALSAAKARRPDLVLLDLGLPGGMPGGEVARRLRAQASTATVPIFYLTGREPEDLRGADGVILKPFTPTVLRDRVAEWLR
jgi:DNA-binding response OmpR family regulator